MATVLKSTIESVVAEVRARRAGRPMALKSGWKEAFGTVPDDALFREAARLGEQWRQKENERR
jgi:hypothetical protein